MLVFIFFLTLIVLMVLIVSRLNHGPVIYDDFDDEVIDEVQTSTTTTTTTTTYQIEGDLPVCIDSAGGYFVVDPFDGLVYAITFGDDMYQDEGGLIWKLDYSQVA